VLVSGCNPISFRQACVCAGGIGFHLSDRIRAHRWDEVGFIIMIVVAVALIDMLSHFLRSRLIRAGTGALSGADFNFVPGTPAAGDLGAEGLIVIESSKSSIPGVPLLVLANEVSGTTTIFRINRERKAGARR